MSECTICIQRCRVVLLKDGYYQRKGRIEHIATIPKGTPFEFDYEDTLMWHQEIIRLMRAGDEDFLYIPKDQRHKGGERYHYSVYTWGGQQKEEDGGKKYRSLFPGEDENGKNLRIAIHGDVKHPHWDKERAKRRRGEN